MKTFTKVFTTALLLACSSLLCSAAKFDNDVNITVGGKSRKYKLYVPNNVKQNTALVFCLHGTSGSSANRQPNFDGIADSDGIIVVYGHGESVYFPFFGMNAPGWNSTGEWSEDIDYILAIIEDVAAKYSIDRNRIYCCGFSNGGMMTYTVANLLADKFFRLLQSVDILQFDKVFCPAAGGDFLNKKRNRQSIEFDERRF